MRPSDREFLLKDGMILAPRAGVEVSEKCPREYRLILKECMDRGWLTPIATMYDYELTMDKLKETE